MEEQEYLVDLDNPTAVADNVEVEVPEKEHQHEDVEVEIVDDVPPEDRGRKPSEPPTEVTEDELAQYSASARKRIQHFSKGYHDQRRAAEAALREKSELEAFAKRLADENKRLKGTVNQTQEVLLDTAKRTAERELQEAAAMYRNAYDAGDSEAAVAAQQKMLEATLKRDKVNNIQLDPLQDDNYPVQTQTNNSDLPSPRMQRWLSNNPWFQQDPEMATMALAHHRRIVGLGVKPESDDYFDRIDSRMRELFPDKFEDERPRQQRVKSSVVAPTSRSTSPKKVVLTKTQAEIARKMNVPLHEYHKYLMKMENQDGTI